MGCEGMTRSRYGGPSTTRGRGRLLPYRGPVVVAPVASAGQSGAGCVVRSRGWPRRRDVELSAAGRPTAARPAGLYAAAGSVGWRVRAGGGVGTDRPDPPAAVRPVPAGRRRSLEPADRAARRPVRLRREAARPGRATHRDL